MPNSARKVGLLGFPDGAGDEVEIELLPGKAAEADDLTSGKQIRQLTLRAFGGYNDMRAGGNFLIRVARKPMIAVEGEAVLDADRYIVRGNLRSSPQFG